MNTTMTATTGLREALTPPLQSVPQAPDPSTTKATSVEVPVAPDQRRPHPGPSRYHHLLLRLFCSGALLAILCSGYRWWNYAQTWARTDNAYVSGHIHTISSRVAGTVTDVLVGENQMVSAGAVLARLDRRDFEVRRDQATAQLAQSQAQVAQAEAQIAQAAAEATRREALATKAKQDLKRAKALFSDKAGAISKQEFEQAQADADAQSAALQGAQSSLQAARALASAAHAQEKAAQATLADAQLQLSYTEIVTPAAGRIGKKNLEPGNRVVPGQALLALVQPEVWVTANFKETQLAHIKPGQTAELEFDAFPGRHFKGSVESLAPASGAQFALLPPDNATGNFTRIVQRVPVKIVLDASALANSEERIVPGMSAIVKVKRR